jgi:N-acetylglucosaminyldiphosphoundecaprenol N-acetyl-beta-D-mannosaminyltransferase
MNNFNSSSAPRVADVRIDLVDRVILLEKLQHSIGLTAVKPPLEIIHTLNPEICMYAWKNPEYKLTLNSGTANVVDGIGLKIALKRITKRNVQRICGSDLIFDLAEISMRSGRALMLIGGSPSRVEKACTHLEERFPGLRVIGCSPPYSSTLPLQNQKEIEQLVIDNRPAVLAVCLGAPKQELWLQVYKDFLHLHDVRVAAGLGGTIDFLSGAIPRAPVWIRKMGLEWLYRLSIEPSRWRRQISTLPKFAALSLFSNSFIYHD